MKKLFLLWLLGIVVPMTLAAATPLPQLTFTANEARLKQFYDDVNKLSQAPETSFVSDDAKMVKGTERERMMIRMLLCSALLIDEERYTPFEWAQLYTKAIQQQFFTTKKKTTDITRIERFDDVKQTTGRILESIEEMTAGSQMEMNGYSEVSLSMNLYLAVLKSWMITNIQTPDAKGNASPLPEKVREALAMENDAWWKLTGKAVWYYDKCSTNGEWYSMKPLENGWVVKQMCDRRIASLDLRIGYLLPDSPEAKMLQTYEGKVPGDERARIQYLMDKRLLLADKIAEYDNEEMPEETREAAQDLSKAWGLFIGSLYKIASSINNAGMPSVTSSAFIYDTGLYIDTLLTINQGQAWE